MSNKNNTVSNQFLQPVHQQSGVKDNSNTNYKTNASEIAITKIKLSVSQARRYFDPQALADLSSSIKELGILEPLLVRPLSKGNYELIAGERRYKAAKMAGLEKVPVVICKMDDVITRQVRLVENLQRQDLNSWEETEGILDLLSLKLKIPTNEVISLLYYLQRRQKKATSNQLSRSNADTHNVMGISRSSSSIPEKSLLEDPKLKVITEVFTSLGRMTWESFVKNRLPLLKLPKDIQESLKAGKIEYTKAKKIAQIFGTEQRAKVLKTAIEENLSLKEIQVMVDTLLKSIQIILPFSSSSLKFKYKELSKQLEASQIWYEPKKRKSLEKLLAQIEVLLSNE